VLFKGSQLILGDWGFYDAAQKHGSTKSLRAVLWEIVSTVWILEVLGHCLLKEDLPKSTRSAFGINGDIINTREKVVNNDSVSLTFIENGEHVEALLLSIFCFSRTARCLYIVEPAS
jgi:hypothetical protein